MWQHLETFWFIEFPLKMKNMFRFFVRCTMMSDGFVRQSKRALKLLNFNVTVMRKNHAFMCQYFCWLIPKKSPRITLWQLCPCCFFFFSLLQPAKIASKRSKAGQGFFFPLRRGELVMARKMAPAHSLLISWPIWHFFFCALCNNGHTMYERIRPISKLQSTVVWMNVVLFPIRISR